MKARKNDTRRLFFKHKMCSHTMFYVINREYDNFDKEQERASDPLVGGIMQGGFQCGLLFGTVMGIGKESYAIYGDSGRSTALAILATQDVQREFIDTCGSEDCREIIGIDWKNRWQRMKHTLTNGLYCFNLAQRWGPEAVNAVRKGLESDPKDLPDKCLSCASVLAKRMGATEEEAAIVAGFAGGVGLSGKACGALSAAIWMRSLKWCREVKKKTSFQNQYSQRTYDAFEIYTEGKFLCSEITGRRFRTLEDHTRFIEQGGCSDLMDLLVQS